MSDKKDKDLIRPLAALAGQKPDAPAWFKQALGAPREDKTVSVAGATIHYSAWGSRGAPGLLLVHGGRAHRRWWFPFAPLLSENRRVAALDLSGLGDSDWRDRYSLSCHAEEIFAVCEAAGLNEGGRPIVLGHSFGGWATLGAVEMAGERLGGAIIVDSPFGVPDPDEGYTINMGGKKDGEQKERPNTNRIYASREEPISRFRFLPSQPGEELYLIDYIAREGLKPATDDETSKKGWAWKFDPRHGQNFEIHFERDLFLAARCPLAFIYGEKSLFSSGEGFDHVRNQARGRAPFVVVPGGHHHMMMDQPMAFVAAVRTLLTCWPVRVGL
ncbi:MAG: alpha/beta hydrolase [Pseudomonadota bacterium]